MNKDKVQLWVDALRSGEYQQGKEALKLPDGTFCCLGVACEVAIKDGVVLTRDPSGYRDPFIEGVVWAGSLPQLVVEWLGLDGSPLEESGDLMLPDEPNLPSARYLADRNDSGEADFNEIADIIERNFLA